ncbi:probable serine/threonine-protein kinase DDB_G0283337 [Microplitis mediator]|uniref:probable serine/threonine-protein kinase DDB_G0283337 n=1 Tax=Microplitis mediator TaxID=375433 RepID=UPI00255240EB|nr:probable serine/threonine-protein kinase DDB_G0283337 [Microplitis mediator]
MDFDEINEDISDIYQDGEDTTDNEESCDVSQEANEVKELKVNDTFITFDELEKRIKNKQGVERHIELNLKYYSIRYCCINGGKKFKSMSTGERSSSTFQKGCQASFKVRVNEDGMKLIISDINSDHNHQTIKELYDHLPQTRRMTPEVKKFNKIDHLELEYNDKLNIYEEIISPTVKVSSTSTYCSCLERTSMNLSCRHILLVRKIEKENLFEETLCNERWTRNYYFETQRVFKSSDEQIPVPESIISSIEYKKKILSENEKFRKANEIAKKLPSLAAEVGTKLFTSRFKVLVDLLEAWQNNEEVEIIKITNRNKQKINNSRLSRINLHHDSNNSNNNENDTIIEDSDCDNNNNFNNNNNNNNDDDDNSDSEMLNQLESSKSSDHEFIVDNNTTGGLDYHDVPETNLLKIKVIDEKSTRKNYDLQNDSSNDNSESMKIMVHEPPQPNNNYADSSDDDEDDIDRYLKLKDIKICYQTVQKMMIK